MKSFRNVVSILLTLTLLLSWTSVGFAKSEVSTKLTEDGRVQVILEFNDLEEAQWALGYIGKMKSKKVFQGFEDGTFRPNQPVTRVQAIVTAVRLMGLEEQAIAKPADAILNFKDADLIDKKFDWAKGYILVALENDLFGETEDQLQPDKPASRVWVASLLVKALGLKQEALAQMNVSLDFKDRDEVPAAAVGYINVAVEHSIVSGYPDETFKPNKNVTRAEMSALLDRTNDSILEHNGSVRVNGKVTAVSFGDAGTVTNEVYGSDDGQITIQSFNGDSRTYAISSQLLVQHGQVFIPANQLVVDDAVSAMVQNNRVIDVVLLKNSQIDKATSGIGELKIEIKYTDGSKYELKFKNNKGIIEAEIEQKSGESETKLKGDAAITEADSVLARLALTPDMTIEQINNAITESFELQAAQVKELKVEIKFANGTKLELKDEDDSDDDIRDQANAPSIRGIELNAEGFDNSKVKLKYEWDNGKTKAEIEKSTADQSLKLSGQEAAAQIEQLLEHVGLTAQMNEEEAASLLLSALGMDAAMLKKFEAEVKFSAGTKLKLELKNEKEDNN